MANSPIVDPIIPEVTVPDMPPPTPEVTADLARQALQADMVRRMQAADQEIGAILQKYELSLAINPQVHFGPDGSMRFAGNISFVPAQKLA